MQKFGTNKIPLPPPPYFCSVETFSGDVDEYDFWLVFGEKDYTAIYSNNKIKVNIAHDRKH